MKIKIFITSIFILLALASYQKYSEYSVLKSIDSYESCAAAKGSTIQESYPATCVTRLNSQYIQPIKNSNDDWKIFNNPQYNFTFEYPESWDITSIYNVRIELSPKNVKDKNAPRIMIQIVNNPENKSLSQLHKASLGLENYHGEYNVNNSTILVSGNIAAYSKNTDCQPLICDIYYFTHSAKIYSIQNIFLSDSDTYNINMQRQILNQILSSFKFTN